MSAVAPSLQAEVRAPLSHVKRPNRHGKHRVAPLTQAMDLKDIAYRDVCDDKTPIHIRAALMRAWADLQEIVMALRGQGKPKPVEARNGVKRGKQTNAAPVSERNEVVVMPNRDIAPKADE